MTAPLASCGAVRRRAAGLALGHGELDELVAQNGGAVDGGADVGGDAHAVVEGQRHLGPVAVERDGGDRADRDVGQLHLRAVGEVADVVEDGRGRALRPARRPSSPSRPSAEHGQRRRDEEPAATAGARIRTSSQRRGPSRTAGRARRGGAVAVVLGQRRAERRRRAL